MIICIYFYFEGQTDFGFNDGFWVPVQGKGLCEFFLNKARTVSRGHKLKIFKKHLINQHFFKIIFKVKLILALMMVLGYMYKEKG